MKHTFSFLILICFFQLATANTSAENEKLEAIDEQLEMLLPGTGLQEQSSRMYAKERLQILFSELDKRKVSKKKTHKAIQIIKEEVEGLFLLQFSNFSGMEQLFKQGNYDQSTASALYAIVFKYFDLPYSIQVRASDILLISTSDNSAQNIKIPASRSLNDSKYRAFQMAYIELLRSINILSPEEWEYHPEYIFNTYYIGKKDEITLKELASFLHYRQALEAYEQKRWVACLDRISQAQNMSDLPLYGVLERVVWLQLANEDKTSKQSLHYLWKLWNSNKSLVWQSELINRFNQETNQLKPATQWKIDSIYNLYQTKFGDNESAKEQLLASNYLIQARFFAQEGRTVEVMNFMDSLYLMRPEDKEVQKVLAGMLVWSLKSEREYEKGLQRISYYEQKYPFLKNDPIFQDQHLFYRAERVRYHFDADEYVLGNIYLKEFELLIAKNQSTARFVSWVSTVYLSSSYYYFRENDYSQALALVEKALTFAPKDEYLLHRQDLLKRYIR